ncbi:hypothetical protein A9404_06845 [Halothiobacillus diazotrophicus]|uniref:Uncharacterized protein n=1 Tax=Halothiobacillus diazotrophicus TaxID=1860122 RepID=A0A191ZGZ8_9GAMM|nr:hypothetical protein [Halothiobacillus diazotrophicus]ANJ67140.1 hypothetical protein A9404_06845 [Halothiobacillus diazotrophicus]
MGRVSAPLPEVLADRLDVLRRLGIEVDAQTDRWLADQTGVHDVAAINAITEARRMIELTVDMAVAHGCAEHPDLLAMRAEWEQRFARTRKAMENKQRLLTDSLRHHLQQNRAARAYIDTEGLGL